MTNPNLKSVIWRTDRGRVYSFRTTELAESEIRELRTAVDNLRTRPHQGSYRFEVVAEFADVTYYAALAEHQGVSSEWYEHIMSDVCDLLNVSTYELYSMIKRVMEVKHVTHGVQSSSSSENITRALIRTAKGCTRTEK